MDQQILVRRADSGVNFLVLVADTEPDATVVKLEEEIILVFFLDLMRHFIIKAMQAHGKLLRICAGKLQLRLISTRELLHTHVLAIEIQAH